MRRIREVLRLRAELGPNLSALSAGAKLARSTVRADLDRATAAGLDAVTADGLSETALAAALYPPSSATDGRTLPDWAEVDQELRRHKHVTRKLLWMEYKTVQPDGLGFSQFKLRLSEWQKASGRGLSMRQVHHAGETVQVDYAGDTVVVVDDGTARAAQIFVACLPCSGLIYAEASWTQATDDWLGAHVRLFAFLDGVPAKVVPDYVPGHVIGLMCRPPLCAGPPANPGTARRSGSVRPHINQSAASHSMSFGSLCQIGFRGGPTDELEGGRHASRASCFILIFISA
jgi:hypothetical protein